MTHLEVPDFQVLFDGLPTAYLVLTSDLHIVEANEAYLQLLSRTREQLIGSPVFEAFPPSPDSLDPDGRNPVQVSFERVLATGEADTMPLQQYDLFDPATGAQQTRYWSLIHAALKVGGATAYVLQRVEDVTDYVHERRARWTQGNHNQDWRERMAAVEADLFARAQELVTAQEARDLSARRLASVAEVALALVEAHSLENLERIVVGKGLSVLGASAGAVVTRAGDGGWRVTTSPDLGEHVRLTYGRLPYDSPLPASWTARTGQELLLPTRESGLSFHPDMASVYADTGRNAWVCLPLVAQETLGALAVAWTDEHVARPDELELMRGLAAQCAQALQRLRAAQAREEAIETVQRMSETLQRRLLSKPPEPDHMQVAVRYQPAAQQAQVGGDWYDAFLQRDGSTMLVIGDVIGHDIAAAAAMGQLRSLLRGIAATTGEGPAAVLRRLDEAMELLQVETTATAVVARFEQSPGELVQGSTRMRWSNAGHPPPLVLHADGSVTRLFEHEVTEADLLLGFDPTTARAEHVVRLERGDTVLLYTDGLVERRDVPIEDGIATLCRELGELADVDLEQMLDVVVARLLPDVREDDIALAAVRLHRQDVPRPPEAGPNDVPEVVDRPSSGRVRD